MPTDSAAALGLAEEFEYIRQFQLEVANRDWLKQHRAFGTAIGKAIRQAGKSRGQRRKKGLSLRVFVLTKPTPSSKKKPVRFEWELDNTIPFKGRKVRIDIVKVGAPVIRRALISSKEPFKSGFFPGMVLQRKGALSGWAWHSGSNSLVLMSCYHVLGNQEAKVFDDKGNEIGLVRSGTEVQAGGVTNRLDAAIADPQEAFVLRERCLERLAPVLSTGSPKLTPKGGTPVARYRNWSRRGGMKKGMVDAMSVQLLIDYDHGTCWFEDLFIVRADQDALWGNAGDSGTLILDASKRSRADLLAEQYDGFGPAIGTGKFDPEERASFAAVGVYMAAMPEGMYGDKRDMAIACDVSRVFKEIGAEPIGINALLAFLDSCYETTEPLDFLALRRPTLSSTIQRPGQAAGLVEYMRKARVGLSLLGLVNRYLPSLVGKLVVNADLRRNLAEALHPLLQPDKSPKDVLARTIDDHERTQLLDVIKVLGRESNIGMKQALLPFEQAVGDKENLLTVGSILRAVDKASPKLCADA